MALATTLERAAIRQSRESFPLESQAEGPFRETTLHAYRWLSVMRPVAALRHLLFIQAIRRPERFHSVATLIRVPSAARTERRSFASRREQRTAGGRSPRRCVHFHATAPPNGDHGCRRVAHNPSATRRRPLPRSRPIRRAPLEERTQAIQTPHPAKPAAQLPERANPPQTKTSRRQAPQARHQHPCPTRSCETREARSIPAAVAAR